MAELRVVSPDGQIGSLDDSEWEAAQAQGFKIATPEDEQRAAQHKRALEHHSGRLGEVAALTGSAADMMTFGAFDPLLEAASPDTYNQLKLAREANPIASGVGSLAGFGGSFASPLVKGSIKAGQKALAHTGSRIAQFGTEGAVMAAPKVAAELVTGDEEEAAEALLWSVGIGGATGAIAGGGEKTINAARRLLQKAKTKTEPLRQKVTPYLSDKADEMSRNAYGRASGLQKSHRAKMSDEEFKEFSDYVEREIFPDAKAIFTTKTIRAQRVREAREIAGKKIGDVAEEAGEVGIFVDGDDMREAVRGIESDELFKYNKSVRAAHREEMRYIDNLITEQRQNFVRQKPGARVDAVYDYKTSLGPKAYSEVTGQGKMTPKGEYYRTLERVIDGQIVKSMAYADEISKMPLAQRGVFNMPPARGGMQRDLARMKYDYKHLTTAQRGMDNILARTGNQQISLRGLTAMMSGSIIGGPAGAIAFFLAERALEEFGDAAVAIGIRRAIDNRQAALDYIAKMSKKVLKPPRVNAKARVGSMGVLNQLSGEKDKQKATDEIISELGNITGNPQYAATKMADISSGIAELNEKSAVQLNQQMLRVAQIMQSVAPSKPPKNPFSSNQGRYTNTEIGAFERALATAIDPLTILDDLQNNTLEPGSVKVLAQLYPRLYDRMKTEILSAATEEKRTYTYAKKLNLDIFFGQETDAVNEAGNIALLQKNFGEDEKNPARSRKRMDYGSRHQTTAQSLESR